MISSLKHNGIQWHNYWDDLLTNYVQENLEHNILHDVAINFQNKSFVNEAIISKRI